MSASSAGQAGGRGLAPARGSRLYAVILMAPLAALGGCVVTQSQDTPVAATHCVAPRTGTSYWLYVPSTYDAKKACPLVVTLHGARPWDSSKSQIREWKHLAERKGLIVAAPRLRSSSLVVGRSKRRMADLAHDERAILEIIDVLGGQYNLAGPGGREVLLTGFLQGGYALYYVGLRNADKLTMLIARDCHADEDLLDEIEITAHARNMPMMILIGKDGWWPIGSAGWRAYRFLRERKCFSTERRELRGGQLRRPDKAYEYWSRFKGGHKGG